MADSDRKRELLGAALPEVRLGVREVDLLELLLPGLLAPIRRFEPPLNLPMPDGIDRSGPTALRDGTGVLLAVLHPDDRLEAVEAPRRHDFRDRRERPGAGPWVAYAARRAIHKKELAALIAIAEARNARLLLIGDSAGEDYFARVRCLEAAADAEPDSVSLFLAPLNATGPGAFDAVVAKNLGAVAFVPASSDAPAPHMDVDLELVVPPEPSIARSEMMKLLADGSPLPEGFTFPAVERELRRRYPPRGERGIAVLFTGLSGSGKSTIANVLRAKLMEHGTRPITLLDGDVVRTHLSKGLGFSREDRDTNVRRIGFVASTIAKSGGMAICAAISPYDVIRKDFRRMVAAVGGFVLVHVATPLDECERRDRKGLYAKARRGEISNFTGISDPYEAPEDAEVVIDTTDVSPEHAADEVLTYLRDQGYV